MWYPTELGWKTPKCNIQVFFYSSKFGRSILHARTWSKWIREELDEGFLKQYRKQLWATKIAEKIKAFLLLCNHRSLPVGTWVQKRGIDGKCRLCSSGLESLEHFLWECSHAQDVWSKVMRILTKSRLEGPISLGFALWWRLEKKDWISGDLGRLKAFCVQRKKCIVQQVRESQIWCSNRLSDIWPTIASITIWNIWKSKCKVGLAGEESRPKKTITTLWYDLIMNI